MHAHGEAIPIHDAIEGAITLTAKRIDIGIYFATIHGRNFVVIVPLGDGRFIARISRDIALGGDDVGVRVNSETEPADGVTRIGG